MALLIRADLPVPLGSRGRESYQCWRHHFSSDQVLVEGLEADLEVVVGKSDGKRMIDFRGEFSCPNVR